MGQDRNAAANEITAAAVGILLIKEYSTVVLEVPQYCIGLLHLTYQKLAKLTKS